MTRIFLRPWFWIAFVAVAVTIPIVVAVTRHQALPPPLEDYGPAPDFQLTSHRATPFAAADLRGKVYVTSFIFTRCPTICPIVTAKMREVQARTKHLGERFHLVSISVDPEHDTPAVLARYAKDNEASATRWTFLTGPYERVQAIAEDGFKQAMQRLPPGGAIENLAHGTHLVLVDATGRIRGFYDSADDRRLKELVRDAGLLVNRGN